MPRKEIDPEFFSTDTCELIALLHTHVVRYLIVGGVPVIYYGYIRTTGDIDLFYDREAKNAQRLFRALSDFWGGCVPNLKRWQELTEEGLILQLGVVPNRIDLINDIDGVQFADAWPNRLVLAMRHGTEDVQVPLIGLDDLIKNKEASGRLKDGDDLRFLLRAKAKRK